MYQAYSHAATNVLIHKTAYNLRTQSARNAEQTATMVCSVRALGIDPATPDETRVTLGLKELGKVNY